MKHLIGLLLFLTAAILGADSVDDLLAEVDSAVLEENYTRALSLLEEGKRLYPADPRLPAMSGTVFRERELYNLALAEFRQAESLSPDNPEYLLEIAHIHGFLGDNAAATVVLERVLALDDAITRDEVVDDLSWMYYKTYRMEDGIRLLETNLQKGFDRSWAHTLGTLYAGVYDIEKSRTWYMKSIEDALDNGDGLFASVAYYNLSLLEYSFYRYAEAREMAMRSLDLRDRAGGHLVVAELDFMAWKLRDALDAYRRAESLDDTPLTRVDLASFYRRIGYLDESIRFIGEVMDNPDESWMYHYGIDRIRFAIDLHTVLADAWKGKAEVDRLTPRTGFLDRLAGLVRRQVWRVRGIYHDRVKRSFTVKNAAALRREGNELDTAWNSALAAESYPAATGFLARAREFEERLTPSASPWYDLDIGRENRDTALIRKAIDGFSPDEKDPLEQALAELTILSGRRRAEADRHRYALMLYRMNPGGLRQYGLSLPVRISATSGTPGIVARRARRLLARAGYEISADAVSAAQLTLATQPDGSVILYLMDPDGRTRSSAELSDVRSRKETARVLERLLDGFYFTRMTGVEG